MLNKQWIYAALVRSVRTFAQVMAGGITIGVAFHEIDWGYIASTALVSAIYSILTALAGLPEVDMAKKIEEEEYKIVYVSEDDMPVGDGRIVFLNNEDTYDKDGGEN